MYVGQTLVTTMPTMTTGKPVLGSVDISALPPARGHTSSDEFGHRLAQGPSRVSGDGLGLAVQFIGEVDGGSHDTG